MNKKNGIFFSGALLLAAATMRRCLLLAVMAVGCVAFAPGRSVRVSHAQCVGRRAMAPVATEDNAHDEKVAKALKAMVGFSNSYCKNTGTTYCSDPSIPAVSKLLVLTLAARTALRSAVATPTLSCSRLSSGRH